MARMARSSDSEVTSSSFWTSGAISPMARVTAESPHQPPILQPVSTETMSPALSGRRLGMPWTTCWLTLVQVTAGNGGLPLGRAGVAQEQGRGIVLAEDPGDGLFHVGGGDPRHGHLADLVERLGDHPSGLAHQRDLARALELDRGPGRCCAGWPPCRPRPDRNEGREGRGTMPRWEHTSLDLLVVLARSVIAIGSHCNRSRSVIEKCPPERQGRPASRRASLPVHQPGVIPHHQVAVDLLDQVEADADDDQQARASQERCDREIDVQRGLDQRGMTATRARKAAPT